MRWSHSLEYPGGLFPVYTPRSAIAAAGRELMGRLVCGSLGSAWAGSQFRAWLRLASSKGQGEWVVDSGTGAWVQGGSTSFTEADQQPRELLITNSSSSMKDSLCPSVQWACSSQCKTEFDKNLGWGCMRHHEFQIYKHLRWWNVPQKQEDPPPPRLSRRKSKPGWRKSTRKIVALLCSLLPG